MKFLCVSDFVSSSGQPSYDVGERAMLRERAPRAADFSRQILETIRPFLHQPIATLHVLDIGSGYGHTAIELARACAQVTGIEPSKPLYEFAVDLKTRERQPNVEFVNQGIYEYGDASEYDLIVLDNVLEHLPDHRFAIQRIAGFLKPRGVALIVVPNKLWPLEVHYRLPFLSYLPLRWANWYLRLSGRGEDFTDASYAPTYWGLKRLFRKFPDLSWQFVLPANLSWTTAGSAWHYRAGVAALRRFPGLWSISKVFVIAAMKRRC